EWPGMGQVVPQVRESEVLPHFGAVGAIDHEPGKVILRIDNDPRRKADSKAQREPQHAWSPKLSLVIPEPKPQHGHKGEPVDIGEPEAEPRGESQEQGIRQRWLFL